MVSTDSTSLLSDTLQSQLTRLRQLNTQIIQSSWHWSFDDIPLAQIFSSAAYQAWPTAPLNERQHIAWDKGLNTLWLCQQITVPAALGGYPLSGLILRLSLTWWAEEANIYVDGELVQSGDLFECFTRIRLGDRISPKQTFQVAIQLVSPAHDNGALVRSHLTYEMPADQPTPEPSFVADELAVLATLEPNSQPEIEIALTHLNWSSLLNNSADTNSLEALAIWKNLSAEAHAVPPAALHPFQQSLSQLRRDLKQFTPAIKQHKIQCIGHAHLDMAWLWPIADTWDAAERTFRSILNLQKDFPELTYTHSSPALFEWLAENRPELFQQIQTKVSEGSWSIDAGLWIEPEFNIVSGEAIARHILYGQRYCQEKFGSISTIAWLPDSFGFCWQLPQLLRKGGITTFATLKLSWNDTTEFPHQLFWWQSPDGTRILSLMLPPIGTDIDPTKMADYAAKWENNTYISNTLWLPGLGDHGGGPTRDMLEKARRWKDSPYFPDLTFTTAENYIQELSSTVKPSIDPCSPPDHTDSNSLPIWDSELYLELHRGCYTSHADQKQQNCYCEDLLYQAEVFATVAHLLTQQPYPKKELESAWKKLLFNQFHDILPGTSIPEVFVNADQDWQQIKAMGEHILKESIEAIASALPLPSPPHPEAQPILVFNSLSWPRSAVMSVDISKNLEPTTPQSWTIFKDQEPIESQTENIKNADNAKTLIHFNAQDIPAVGYQYFWLCPINSHQVPSQPEQYILENNRIKVSIDPDTGHITSLIEKSSQAETLRAPGNQLQTFEDKGQYWDAWNIDPKYTDHPLSAPTLESIQWITYGSVQQKLRTSYTFQNSTIQQDYSLETNSPYLKVETHIHWRESQVLLKAHFPLNTSATHATYEIPFGAITRTTQPKTDAEKAQWEVPALRWANLGTSDFSTSILTDCKHGFDAGSNYLRLTLLKSAIWPDPNADKGKHHFTYAIYPYAGNWRAARVVHHARELNIKPIHQWRVHNQTIAKEPSKRSFFQLHTPNLILSALKLSEDSPDHINMRCYEAYGIKTNIETSNTLSIEQPNARNLTDLLEKSLGKDRLEEIPPWSVQTYLLKNKAQRKPSL